MPAHLFSAFRRISGWTVVGLSMETTVEKNHVRPVARAGPVLRALAGVALAILACEVLPGCNKGTDPKPLPKYLLYAATTASGSSEGWVAVIDCATDSVIDSISRGFQSEPGIVASPDGKYFAVLGSGRPPEIFDAVTRTQIKYLSSPSIGPLFLPSARIVLSPGPDSTLVYDIPGFNLKEVWPRPQWDIEPVGSLGRFASAKPTRPDPYPVEFVIFNPDGSPIDSFVISPDSDTLQVAPTFTFSPDGTRFYGVAFKGFRGGLACYDLISHTLLFFQRTNYSFRHCRVSPDGQEVWTTDPGDLHGFSPDHLGSIYVYDAFTGMLKDSVSVYYPGFNRTLMPWNIRFLPNSEKVYINCVGLQPILAINTRTKKVERLIFPDFNRWALEIDLAPQP